MTSSSQRWTLVLTIVASGIIFLDGSVVNIALPSIDRDLQAGLSGLQWIVDGYLLTLGALMLAGGSLGDTLGRRRVMRAGLIGFGVASIVCGAAPSTATLVLARLLQGVAGALLVPASLALIRETFTDERARGKAIGQWSGWSGITTVLGPLLGGWLVDAVSWRAIFLINVPFVAFALWLLESHVRPSHRKSQQKLDWWGTLLGAAGLAGLAFALIEGPVNGWNDAWVIMAGIIGLASLGGFIIAESRQGAPMLPLEMFRSSDFTGANLTTLGVYFALYGSMFVFVIYLQNVLDYSALASGLALAPVSALLLLFSARSGALSARYGSRWFMAGGATTVAAGLALLSRVAPGSSYASGVLPGILVMGVGLTVTVAPLTNTVVSAVSEKHAGVASGFNNVVSRVAALLAVAILGAVMASSVRSELRDGVEITNLGTHAAAQVKRVSADPTGRYEREGVPPRVVKALDSALTAGMRNALLVSAALALAGAGAAALIVGGGRRNN
jgi:EmrB/QacA subfamily drug resistance transporter